VTTGIGFGGEALDKSPTAYFRASFNLTDASLYSSLRLRLRRDDTLDPAYT